MHYMRIGECGPWWSLVCSHQKLSSIFRPAAPSLSKGMRAVRAPRRDAQCAGAWSVTTESITVTAEGFTGDSLVRGNRPSVVAACSHAEESASDALSVATDVEESVPANE
jgi:hypothetical protein